jgi:hypothetical protein
MKKLIIVFISMMMLFLFSCSVDEDSVLDPSSDSGQLKCYHPKGAVFTVTPSGTDDTQALIDAFNAAKAAGPGSTVQLVEGQYTIGMIEVRDFDGYFRGAGMNMTFISNLPDLPCNECWTINNNIPFLMQFISGNVSISDFSFHIIDGIPCPGMPDDYKAWTGEMLGSVLILGDYTAAYVPDPRYIKAAVRNVGFIPGDIEGGSNPWGSGTYNVDMAIYCGTPKWYPGDFYPLSSGEISISGCYFENIITGPDVFGFDKNSKAVIENNFLKGCFEGIFLASNLGTKLSVVNNKIQEGLLIDIYIDDYDYGMYPDVVLDKRTECTIMGNNIQSPAGVTGVYISDTRRTDRPDEGFPQLFDIKFNNFNTQDGATAIYGLNQADAKIWNNKFTGTGAVGVMLDGTEATNTWAENNKLMGNNFTGATYTDAAVLLGAYTKNCTVVGVPSDLVVNLGVNNKVIGVKAHKQGPHHGRMLGRLKSMQDNMMRMRPARPQ